MTIEQHKVTRRDFLKAAPAAASTFTILNSTHVFGSTANSRINVGVIGTGGRGRYDAGNLMKTGGAQVVALADYFDFQLTEPAATFGVKREACFTGLDGYKGVIGLKEVDAVLLTAPPYSRPEQFQAAIQAGKHVFAEKPVAVDAWGCRNFQETGRQAAEKKVTVVVGLQSRYDPGRQKIAQAIHDGAIGKPVAGHSQRMGDDLWRRPRPAEFSERDHQIRHWLYYLWASGDFIVEMHIHNLDVLNWFAGLLPVSAFGAGGRTVRKDVGDILDHISVLYEYPDGYHLTHTGTQISTGLYAQAGQIVGSSGFYDSAKGLQTKDKQILALGDMEQAAQEEMRQFLASVTGQGPYVNNTEYTVTSNFACILGRTAAYRKQKVTWQELWDSNERIPMPV